MSNSIEPFGSSNFDEDDDSHDRDGLGLLRGKFGKYGFALIGVIVLIAGSFFLGSKFSSNSVDEKLVQTIGKSGSDASSSVFSASELRDVILRSKLVAYWAGPIDGYKYALAIPKAGVVVIRYLPDGKGLDDPDPNYRVIGTYVQKGATEAVVSSGKKEGSVGFTNIDGNAVFYVRSRPTNVYMAIKNKDIQVEIFDPGQDQAVALSLFKGQIVQIK